MFMLWVDPAAAGGSVEVVEFDAEQSIRGFPRHPTEPACDIHFEWQDPRDGWRRFVVGTVPHPASEYFEVPVLPAHSFRSPTCGNDVPEADFGWRIVDGAGAVVTEFEGAFAIDAWPLAARLGELAAYRKGKRSCSSATGSMCWTALELWLYLEDWQDEHCAVEESSTEP